MSHACELLKTTDLSMQEIAARIGLNDQFYFSRLLQYARAERFLPFSIVLKSGTIYGIENRDRISIPPPEITENGEEYADYFIAQNDNSRR